jgi:hypothetical protein
MAHLAFSFLAYRGRFETSPLSLGVVDSPRGEVNTFPKANERHVAAFRLPPQLRGFQADKPCKHATVIELPCLRSSCG